MYLVFDIGATNTRIGVSGDAKKFTNTCIYNTPKSFVSGMKTFEIQADKLLKGRKVKAIAGGIAGPLDYDKTKVIGSLKGWINKPLQRTLREHFKAPVYIENDAAIVGLGEAHAGAGKYKSIVAYITVSTNIGGCRIVDGKIDRNAMGFEPGRQVIKVEGTHKKIDEWQNVSLGMALKLSYGKHPETNTSQHIWSQAMKYLAYGLANITVLWSPDIIILGGGVMKSNYISLPIIKSRIKKVIPKLPKLPLLKKATLGDIGGLHGALVYIHQQYTK